jgi:hypothetical protein
MNIRQVRWAGACRLLRLKRQSVSRTSSSRAHRSSHCLTTKTRGRIESKLSLDDEHLKGTCIVSGSQVAIQPL